MYPINIALKPISQNSTKPALQPVMTQKSTAVEKSGNTILDAIQSVLNYIFKHIFSDASHDEQQAARTWASSAYQQNNTNPDEERTVVFRGATIVTMEMGFTGKKIVTISVDPSGNASRVSWLIRSDGSNSPLVYKNDFSWMD